MTTFNAQHVVRTKKITFVVNWETARAVFHQFTNGELARTDFMRVSEDHEAIDGELYIHAGSTVQFNTDPSAVFKTPCAAHPDEGFLWVESPLSGVQSTMRLEVRDDGRCNLSLTELYDGASTRWDAFKAAFNYKN